jgi:signal transduction histidine kinase
MERQRRLKADPTATRVSRHVARRIAMGTIEGPAPTLDVLRGDDVAQIVHDLRDPLATISLEAHLLDRKLTSGDHTDVKPTVARIIRNIEFLDRMVQDLLDSCSTDEGHLQLHRRPTDLRALLEQVVHRVVPTRDLERVSLEATHALRLSIDAHRIERVVANLLANALKYTPRCGGIIVRLERGPHAARVSVIDAGPGLAPAEAQHVFDKYRRGIAARGLEGCGLGLYASKRIVEAHGGRIGVESLLGAGSRFYFDLPMLPAG